MQAHCKCDVNPRLLFTTVAQVNQRGAHVDMAGFYCTDVDIFFPG